jgi:hypothetical protein
MSRLYYRNRREDRYAEKCDFRLAPPLRGAHPLAGLRLLSLDATLASGGITEFSSPLEQVVNTITGPAGKWISIVAMALCGVIFIMNKNENKRFLPSAKVHLSLYNQIITRS